jgi:hypothetical protein
MFTYIFEGAIATEIEILMSHFYWVGAASQQAASVLMKLL